MVFLDAASPGSAGTSQVTPKHHEQESKCPDFSLIFPPK